MFIRHITIQNLGAISFFEAEFSQQVTLLRCRHTAELSAALAFLMYRDDIPEHWLQENTRLRAQISLAGVDYALSAISQDGRLQLSVTDPEGADATALYQYTLRHCQEQDAAEIFDGKDRTLPLRLCRYRYRAEGDNLSVKTRRLADTHTFRQYLLQYIKAFRPEPIHSQKQYQIATTPCGKFTARFPGVPGKVYLSETEQRLFHYLCFLHVAEFWAGFEKLRDLHHEKKPLVIQNFLELLDESADIRTLLTRTRKLQRQIIVLTPQQINMRKDDTNVSICKIGL